MRDLICIAFVPIVLLGCAQKSTRTENFTCKMHLNLCYLEVSLNDSRPLQMILDSGSSFTVVNSNTSALPNFHKVSEGSAAGPGATSSGKYILYDHVDLLVGTIELPNQSIISLPFDYVFERTGVPTDGTIGAALFKKYVVKMNYSNGSVELVNPVEFVADKSYLAIPFEFEGDVPVVAVDIQNKNGKSVTGHFIVDTGQMLSGLIISAPFHYNHGAIFESLKSNSIETVSAVGGQLQFQRGFVSSISIGGLIISSVPTAFLKTAAGVYSKDNIAGGIGADVLRQFDVIFDYSRKVILLRPL